jgi:hypothetical protein
LLEVDVDANGAREEEEDDELVALHVVVAPKRWRPGVKLEVEELVTTK